MTITSLPDTASMTIEDVQGRADTRRIPINQVVIKAIRHPVRVSEPSGGQQHTIATASMYVNLPEDVKGTHMSRFVQLLNEHDRHHELQRHGHRHGRPPRRGRRAHRYELPVLRHQAHSGERHAKHARLTADPRVRAYSVESKNFESIHNCSAYARIDVDKDA